MNDQEKQVLEGILAAAREKFATDEQSLIAVINVSAKIREIIKKDSEEKQTFDLKTEG